jgi:hypothetical protein
MRRPNLMRKAVQLALLTSASNAERQDTGALVRKTKQLISFLNFDKRLLLQIVRDLALQPIQRNHIQKEGKASAEVEERRRLLSELRMTGDG